MTIKHHLTDALIMGYAAGNLPEAFSLAVAAHVSLCDDCRAALAAHESLGGVVLAQDDAVVPLSDGSLDACFARIAAAPADLADPAPLSKHPILPQPLLDYIGPDLAAVKWRSVGMGVRQAILPTCKGATARLLYIPAGQALPDHGHRGLEMTLVLQGAFRDNRARFARGDVEIATEADAHTPVAEDGEDCICLAVTDAPLRFSAMMPRLLQPLFRI